ncbi:DUF2852 domain-containing protein [Oceanomicrobium pacificus]|nr:DUF2852 domain-containing protein [Oceanomicrobium pacificus]
MHSAQNWLRDAENWLDARGKAAWIAATVLGFIVFWPIGLALLAYMIMRKPMCGRTKKHRFKSRFSSTGNHAFDSYREETLKRLEDEQTAFTSFLDRLRQAKDQAEFDQFMNERRTGTDAPRQDTPYGGTPNPA